MNNYFIDEAASVFYYYFNLGKINTVGCCPAIYTNIFQSFIHLQYCHFFLKVNKNNLASKFILSLKCFLFTTFK